MRTLVAIIFLSKFFLLPAGFAASSPGIENPSRFSVLNPETSEFAKPGAYPVRGESASTLAMLESGEGSFRARIESLRSARRSVRIQTLLFEGDEAGAYIARELIRKQREGVNVRVILDLYYAGKTRATRMLLHDLESNGIEVVGFDPTSPGFRPNGALFHDGFRLNKRLHEKIWLIDSEEMSGAGIGIVGGLNIANEYFRIGFNPERIWRDQDVLLKGEVLRDLTASFDENFANLTRAYRTVDLWSEKETERFQTKNRDLHERGRFETETQAAVSGQIERILGEGVPPVALPARMRYLRSRPREGETFITDAYLRSIADARSEIVISNAYFIPDRTFRRALKDAARRGVRVVLHTNDAEGNNLLPMMTTLSRKMYRGLLSANDDNDSGGNVSIFEWNGDETGQYTLHSKWMIVDRTFGIVGSYNIDPRSEHLNSENAIAFENPELAAQLLRLFENDLVFSLPITREQADKWAGITGWADFWRSVFGNILKANL